MNYTIAVPIFKDEKVAGSIFGSIYFQDIEGIINHNMLNSDRSFYILGENNGIMAGNNADLFGQNFLAATVNTYFLGTNSKTIDGLIHEGISGDSWEWGPGGLTYMMYERIAPTNWTIAYRVSLLSVIVTLLPVLCLKICFYIITCAIIHLTGRRYLNRYLAEVNHLLDRMAVMQMELFQSEQPNYNNLLELTPKGLTDQLTNLSTRAVLFKKMVQIIDVPDSFGAVVFIDLDDLKRINDNFGHESGDCALLHFAKILKEYEARFGGITARYGGDEFILILNAIEENAASEITRVLCKDLNTSLTVKKYTFLIHGSLGVSFYPTHGTKPEELICKADLALYTAKQEGKNQCAFYVD